MNLRQTIVALLIGSSLGACSTAPPVSFSPTPAAAPTDSAASQHRFFKDLPYGTDAQFNPLSVIANHGFDQLRTSPRTDITRYPFGASFHAVLKSVVQPDKPIRAYGYRNWLRNEVFPLTLRSQGGGQWYPNYTLHLFGDGITYVRLVDWYDAHGFASHPEIAAGVTHYAYHLLVEAIENGPTADRGVDALTDLLIFDSSALVLWNQSWMRGLFSGGPVEVNDWLGQVSMAFPGRTVENASAMVMVRSKIPRVDDWRVMITHGYLFSVGVSRRIGKDSWLTLGSGADAPANPVIDTLTEKKTASLEPNGAIFFDRNGSLLASLVTRGGSNNGVTVNVYPGVLNVGGFRPSFWVQRNKGGGVRFGVSSQLGIGVSTFAGIHR